MTAMPTDIAPGSDATASPGPRPASLAIRWNALHEAADAVAVLAGIEPERPDAAIRNFPSAIRDEGGWKLELAEQGIADMCAMMQPGLGALLAVRARGQDAGVPARTLWREFGNARQALLDLVPQSGALGPRRKA